MASKTVTRSIVSTVLSGVVAFLHMSNALLVTAVHVKMKLGDNALNNERLSLV